jgi:phospholipid-transporting ATPase
VLRCNSVVCCRTSPKQKAMMVNLIKERQENTTTLAIGDGANDVNMITTAHIGIGIVGVEGMQAARASDYAIGQFSFLRRLLLVHGRESYRKNSYVVCYNFYKNVLFVAPQFWFGIVSFYSGQTLYDPWIYQLFNIVFASIPIIWFGIYDQETKYSVLYLDSRYYIQGVVNKLFHTVRFWKWVIYGLLQASILFVFAYYCNNSIDQQGYHQDLFSVGSMIYSSIVLLVNFRILLSTNTHSVISISIFFLSIFSYYIIILLMSYYYRFANFNNFYMIMTSSNFYLSTLLILVLCLVIDMGMVKLLKLYDFIENPLYIKPEEIDKHLVEVDMDKLIEENAKYICNSF